MPSAQNLPVELNKSERLALELIWINKWSSRIAIAENLGVSKMQATNLSRALTDKGLIAEKIVRDGARGQPTRRLELVADAAYAIGINIWRTVIEVGILNSAGQLTVSERFSLKDFSVEEISATVGRYIHKARTQKKIKTKKICGVGISSPGDFDRKGHITQAYFPSWNGVDLRQQFQKHFDFPVLVENNGACAAWGERLIGAATNIQDFIFLNIDYGIGGGVVTGGRLMRGHNGNAGVFGVPFSIGAARPSGQDLLETLREGGIDIDDLPQLDNYEIANLPLLSQWVDRAAKQLQQPLNVLAGAFDPAAIIIGGRLPPSIIAELVNRIEAADFCAITRPYLPIPQLVPSKLADTAGVAGAAGLAFAHAHFAGD